MSRKLLHILALTAVIGVGTSPTSSYDPRMLPPSSVHESLMLPRSPAHDLRTAPQSPGEWEISSCTYLACVTACVESHDHGGLSKCEPECDPNNRSVYTWTLYHECLHKLYTNLHQTVDLLRKPIL